MWRLARAHFAPACGRDAADLLALARSVLFTAAGTVRLADFGLSRLLEGRQRTAASQVGVCLCLCPGSGGSHTNSVCRPDPRLRCAGKFDRLVFPVSRQGGPRPLTLKCLPLRPAGSTAGSAIRRQGGHVRSRVSALRPVQPAVRCPRTEPVSGCSANSSPRWLHGPSSPPQFTGFTTTCQRDIQDLPEVYSSGLRTSLEGLLQPTVRQSGLLSLL